MIRYSRGTGIHDNKPAQRHAEDFARFVESLERDRAPTKERAHYICAPLNGDGTRRREGVLPRTWIALDFDHLPADVLPDLRTWLARFEGCAWPTHSSKPDAPRERALIAMDRPASREECLRVGAALVRDIKDEFGIEVDPATLRGEQPVFGPPVGVQIAKFFGDPLPVDKYLASAPTVEEVKTAPVELRNGEAIRAGGRDAALTSLAGRLRRFGSSESEIEAYLSAVNQRRCVPPLSAADVAKIARSTARYAPEIDGFEAAENAPESNPIRATAFRTLDPKAIPPRKWLYGGHYARRYVSATVAAGGVGKSSLQIVEALSMCCGRDLLRNNKPLSTGPLRVWLYQLEDPREEIERRIMAAVLRYGLKPEDYEGRLFVDSGRDRALIVAHEIRGELVPVPAVEEQLIAEAKANGIDVLAIDPYVSSHRVPENNNTLQDAVMQVWKRIADACDMGIDFAHHTRKGSGTVSEVDTDDMRGAGALKEACRSVRVLANMTKDEAEKYGIERDRRRFYLYCRSAKVNMVPPVDSREWLHLASIDLGNGDGVYPSDSVGVVERWAPPSALETVTNADLAAICTQIANLGDEERLQRAAVAPQSGGWLGHAVGALLDLDSRNDEGKAQIKRILDAWVSAGSLQIVEVVRAAGKKKGRSSPCYAPGKAAVFSA